MAKKLNIEPELIRNYLKEQRKLSAAEIPSGRKALYLVLLTLIPFLLIAGLEIALRVAHFGPDLRLFVPYRPDQRYLMINPSVGLRYFPTTGIQPETSHNILLKNKPPGLFRIFVLGGSSAAGYPYLHNGSFSAVLSIMLKEMYPSRRFEVVNLAMPAVNSYTVRDFALELPRYKPDLVIVYAGHNEFYGALGVGSSETLGKWRGLINFFLRINRFKTVQLISKFIGALKKGVAGIFGRERRPSGTLMERMVRKKYIPYNSADFQGASRIFSENIEDVLSLMKKRHIPVMLSTLVSNVRDQKPFVDAYERPENGEKIRPLLRQARERMHRGNLEAALSAIRQCRQIDSLAATPVYLEGEILIRKADSTGSYRAFYRAKELDALRFRASEKLNEILINLAQKYHQPLCDIKTAFEERSPEHIPGNNLLIDHLHPNYRGYRLMARAFAEKIAEMKIISEKVVKTSQEISLKGLSGVTAVDSIAAAIRIRVLKSGWPFTNFSVPDKNSVVLPDSTFAEKLAAKYWMREITWEQMHVEAAQVYTRTGRLDRAEREYRALMLDTPANPSPYEFLARLLIFQKKFREAEPVLRQLLELKKSHFAYKMLGALLVNRRNLNEGIHFLEKAYALSSRDPQTLFNLAGAYSLDGKKAKALRMIQKLLEIQPDYPGAQHLAAQIRRLPDVKAVP